MEQEKKEPEEEKQVYELFPAVTGKDIWNVFNWIIWTILITVGGVVAFVAILSKIGDVLR